MQRPHLNENKLFLDREFGLSVRRVARHQFQQSLGLVEPLAKCGHLSVELHLVVSQRVEAGPLGVAGRRTGDGERDRLVAVSGHGHRL